MLSLQFPAYPTGAHWVPTPYMMPTPAPLQQVDDGYSLPAHMNAAAAAASYKNDGQPPRGISVMLPSPEATVQYNQMIPQVRMNL